MKIDLDLKPSRDGEETTIRFANSGEFARQRVRMKSQIGAIKRLPRTAELDQLKNRLERYIGEINDLAKLDGTVKTKDLPKVQSKIEAVQRRLNESEKFLNQNARKLLKLASGRLAETSTRPNIYVDIIMKALNSLPVFSVTTVGYTAIRRLYLWWQRRGI